ncbi:MAG: S8 family serine peptidase, partial [Calditrichaeota bacterium]|nr:S8 family serine peptidase [Calditrichota bacterium]
GSDIWSAQPGGGYQFLSGTSMAGPHVAGVVALMRAANPNVDVNTIKQVLMDTAYEIGSDGSPGEDNTFGHGMVDAYEAVLAVMSGYGSLEGTVSDASNGNPIDGALISNPAGSQQSSSNASGDYAMFLPADTYSIEYSAFGYTAQTVSGIVIVDNATTTQNVSLSPAPSAMLFG